MEAATLKREAVFAAEQVAKAYPDDALAYALLGSAHYNTGQSDEATKHLRKCLELSPDQADAYEILARVAYEKGELEETARLCRESLQRGPASPDALNRLGRAQMDLGQTEEAIRTLQQAVRLPKPTSESCYLLGQAHLQSGDYEQAKEDFRRAIALLPDHTQAHFGLYTACLRLGQMEEAGRYREQFLKLEGIDRRTLSDRSAREDTLTGLPMVRETVARTIFGAAQIHRVHGQAAKAADLFRRSAVLDAENPMYRAALEAFYVQRKDLAEGVKVFDQLAAEQPRNSLNHFFLGRLQGQLEQIEAAERSYRKVQELAPEWPEGYRALAELYLRANRKTAEARVLARKALELEPSGPHYFLLAVACLKNQDRPGALEAVKQALALNPGETKYQEFLTQLKAVP
ncbi:MAG: tetratricopeptide repeat protein [Verrucomicrobia bacterium]|nr:tetratricopeptide repeat protein [Verrucomicrobiota bacterium]